MELTINYYGQAVSVSVEVYEYLTQSGHKAENLAHEQRRHWDGREFDENWSASGKPWMKFWRCWRSARPPSRSGSCSMPWTVSTVPRLGKCADARNRLFG